MFLGACSSNFHWFLKRMFSISQPNREVKTKCAFLNRNNQQEDVILFSLYRETTQVCFVRSFVRLALWKRDKKHIFKSLAFVALMRGFGCVLPCVFLICLMETHCLLPSVCLCGCLKGSGYRIAGSQGAFTWCIGNVLRSLSARIYTSLHRILLARRAGYWFWVSCWLSIRPVKNTACRIDRKCGPILSTLIAGKLHGD